MFIAVASTYFIELIIIHRTKNVRELNTEAVAQRCSVKKVFLEISQNSQENTYARDSDTGIFL